MPKNAVNMQKTPKYLGFRRFSFGSISSKNQRNALVDDQSVVKNVVKFCLQTSCSDPIGCLRNSEYHLTNNFVESVDM